MRTAVLLLMVLLAGCDKPIITIGAQPASPRFQLVVTNSEMPNLFTYLLDTQTGALWRQKEITDLKGKPTLWVQEKFDTPVVSSSALNPISDEILRILHPPATKEEEKR